MIFYFSRYNDRDLYGFIKTLTDNEYHIEISRPGTRLKVEVWKAGEKHELMQELRCADQMDQDTEQCSDAGES